MINSIFKYVKDFIVYVMLLFLVGISCTIFPTGNDNNKDPEPFKVRIEKTHWALQGLSEEVSVVLEDGPNFINQYRFLIAYDPIVLAFQTAEPGNFNNSCEWEYFTYRQYSDDYNYENNRVIEFRGIINFTNPNCNIRNQYPIELFKISFLVSNDYTLNCTFSPIRFVWRKCFHNSIIFSWIDNNITSHDEAVFAISDSVFDYDGTLITDYNSPFPTFNGVSELCIDNGINHSTVKRYIDFYDGGIDIVCVDSIDDRCDFNYNGISNDIGEAVLYANYFIYGLGVFDNPEIQIECSDVNADGIVLDLSDFVYLIRIIIGDASPYPQDYDLIPAYVESDNGILSVTNFEVGAVHLVLEGQVVPELLVENMEMQYNFDGENTKILIYSFDGNSFTTEEFINIDDNIIIDISFATSEGLRVYLADISGRIIPEPNNYQNPNNKE